MGKKNKDKPKFKIYENGIVCKKLLISYSEIYEQFCNIINGFSLTMQVPKELRTHYFNVLESKNTLESNNDLRTIEFDRFINLSFFTEFDRILITCIDERPEMIRDMYYQVIPEVDKHEFNPSWLNSMVLISVNEKGSDVYKFLGTFEIDWRKIFVNFNFKLLKKSSLYAPDNLESSDTLETKLETEIKDLEPERRIFWEDDLVPINNLIEKVIYDNVNLYGFQIANQRHYEESNYDIWFKSGRFKNEFILNYSYKKFSWEYVKEYCNNLSSNQSATNSLSKNEFQGVIEGGSMIRHPLYLIKSNDYGDIDVYINYFYYPEENLGKDLEFITEVDNNSVLTAEWKEKEGILKPENRWYKRVYFGDFEKILTFNTGLNYHDESNRFRIWCEDLFYSLKFCSSPDILMGQTFGYGYIYQNELPKINAVRPLKFDFVSLMSICDHVKNLLLSFNILTDCDKFLIIALIGDLNYRIKINDYGLIELSLIDNGAETKKIEFATESNYSNHFFVGIFDLSEFDSWLKKKLNLTSLD